MSDERIAALIEGGERLRKEATAKNLWEAEMYDDFVILYSGGYPVVRVDVGGNPRADRERVFHNLHLAAFAVNSFPALVAAVKEQGRWRHLDTEKPREGELIVIGSKKYGFKTIHWQESWLPEFHRKLPAERYWMPIPALPAPPAKEGE